MSCTKKQTNKKTNKKTNTRAHTFSQSKSATKKVELTAKLPEQVDQGMAIDYLVGPSTKVLAASTILKDQIGTKENLGIIVSYQIEVRILINGVSDQTVIVPFILL